MFSKFNTASKILPPYKIHLFVLLNKFLWKSTKFQKKSNQMQARAKLGFLVNVYWEKILFFKKNPKKCGSWGAWPDPIPLAFRVAKHGQFS